MYILFIDLLDLLTVTIPYAFFIIVDLYIYDDDFCTI
jgi:hypothetical protein